MLKEPKDFYQHVYKYIETDCGNIAKSSSKTDDDEKVEQELARKLAVADCVSRQP